MAAIKSGSFIGASAFLRLEPSAISKSVRKLEEELGIPLLKRDGRSIEPTEAGLLIYSIGEGILLLADDIARIAEQHSEE